MDKNIFIFMDIILEKAVENNQTNLIKAAIENGANIDNLYNYAYIFAINNDHIEIAHDIERIRDELKNKYQKGG